MSYNQIFFKDLITSAKPSAQALVPIVYKKLKPRSVLDVGCGLGSWLEEWKKQNVDIYGVDGNWVNPEDLKIPKQAFEHIDLAQPFNFKKKFDLVVTLEVAEHLDESSAKNFVKSLAEHGDIILFSAAIPWQGGTDHFNEQWPTYWIDLFKKEGYVFLDPFRHLIWNLNSIKHHYKQNTILFAKENKVSSCQFLSEEKKFANRSLVSVVHPEKFIRARDPQYRSLKQELPIFFILFKNYLYNLFRLRK